MERPAAIQLGDVIKDKGDVVTLEDTETLYDARNLMIQHSISRLVIFWDNKYAVGIITEKDIVRFLYKGTDGRRLDEITVKEAMSLCQTEKEGLKKSHLRPKTSNCTS